jgi:hypothetical protein
MFSQPIFVVLNAFSIGSLPTPKIFIVFLAYCIYFEKNKRSLSVCVSAYCPNVARQRFGKHGPPAMNTHATIEKILEMWCLLCSPCRINA